MANLCRSPSADCFFFGVESPDVERADANHPFVSVLVPRHPQSSTTVVGAQFDIPHIFGMAYASKIFFSIIQAVAIYVIYEIWLASMVKQPCYPVCVKLPSVDAQHPPLLPRRSGYSASFFTGPSGVESGNNRSFALAPFVKKAPGCAIKLIKLVDCLNIRQTNFSHCAFSMVQCGQGRVEQANAPRPKIISHHRFFSNNALAGRMKGAV